MKTNYDEALMNAKTMHNTLKLANDLTFHQLQGLSYVLRMMQQIAMILNEKIEKSKKL